MCLIFHLFPNSFSSKEILMLKVNISFNVQSCSMFNSFRVLKIARLSSEFPVCKNKA